ncbi:MAG: 1-acyl-sn-glycerol-3-phosphate acyltransferase [Cyclobacteriaceae bacterium]|nr:1-acyl-sn-glycerol-3-phosphate acyltransferase [Cyclobacteriaceae bacterium]
MRWLLVLIFKWMGWRTQGNMPVNINKYIVAVAPHTSNWDFVIGILVRSVLNIQRAKFIGKDSLFKPPFGWFFSALGGYPVDRSGQKDVTDQIAHIFNQHEKFILGLAPEGTRKKVDKLRTGFYYIAKKAHVPIVPIGFDFAKKIVVVAKRFYPTEDFEADMDYLTRFYSTISGRNPELGIRR